MKKKISLQKLNKVEVGSLGVFLKQAFPRKAYSPKLNV